jgi:hypothetical protein
MLQLDKVTTVTIARRKRLCCFAKASDGVWWRYVEEKANELTAFNSEYSVTCPN